MNPCELAWIGMSRGGSRGLALCLAVVVAVGIATAVPLSAEPWTDLPDRWKLRVGDQDAWREVAFDDGGWQSVELREGWEAQGLRGVDGIVWYRRAVIVDMAPGADARSDELAVFLVGPSFGGFQLYAGGELVGESPGWRLPLAVPTEEVYPVPPEAVGPDGSLVLALRLRRVGWASDQALAGAPVGGTAMIGDRTALRDHAELIHAREHLGSLHLLLLAGLFGAVGVYHLLLAAGSRDQKAHLWFGLLALLFAVNTLANSIWIFDLTLRLDWTVRWAAASGHLAAAVAIQFLWALFARRISWPVKGYQISQVGLGIWTLAWPSVEPVVATGALRWLWLAPALALVAVRIVVELRRGDREARLLGGGALVLVVVEAYELGSTLLGLPYPIGFSLAPFGFAAFLGTMGISLWERFRRLHRELEELKDDLERRVRDRIHDLERAKERAEVADRLKSLFLANVSHELRTPLTGILGIFELLRADDLDADRRDLVEQLGRSAIRLQDLIDDLLDFTRAEAGGIEIDRVSFDPQAPISECLEKLAPTITDSGLELETVIAADVPKVVEGDRARLHRVLVHLVDNAVKFTERGTVRISLSARRLEAGRVELVYVVSDGGSGIAAEDLDTLFAPFHQLDGTRARLHGGVGLGLAIVKRFVEAWGGRVSARSTVGRGSSFSFTVPVQAVGDDAEQAAPRDRQGGDRAEGAAERPRDVLVAEDNDVTRNLLGRFLRQLGHRVGFARDGREVLAALKKRCYDVVLMDVQMPGMDGLETGRQIGRRLAPEERPLLVALTAALGPEDRVACKEAGLDELLQKPIDFDALRRLVGGGAAPASGEEAGDAHDLGGGAPCGEVQVLQSARLGQLEALEKAGGEPVVEPLLRSLVSRLEGDLPRASALAQQGDWERLVRLAHSLAGSTSNVGASSLTQHFGAIERAAGVGDRATVLRLLGDLASKVDRLKVEVEKILAQ